MLVNVSTDNYIQGSAELRSEIESILEDALRRYGDRVTRVEVSLTDQNSDKKHSGDDMRCVLEARLAGLQPISVTCDAPSLDQAIDGAVDKLLAALRTRLGRLDHKKGGVSMSGDGLIGEPEPLD
jgi:ribosome-associated translation inhibitor RaiA